MDVTYLNLFHIQHMLPTHLYLCAFWGQRSRFIRAPLISTWQSSTTGQHVIKGSPELTWATPRSGHFYLRPQCLSFLLQWEKSQRSEITEIRGRHLFRRWGKLGDKWGQQWGPCAHVSEESSWCRGTTHQRGAGTPFYSLFLKQFCWWHLTRFYKCPETVYVQDIWNSKSEFFILEKMMYLWFWTMALVHLKKTISLISISASVLFCLTFSLLCFIL